MSQYIHKSHNVSILLYHYVCTANILKSITAKEIYRLYPKVKAQLWGGNIWSEGCFVSTVGKHSNEKEIENYVKNQGKNHKYEQMYVGQLKLFE